MGLRTTALNIGMKVKVTQSCPTVRDPMDYIVHGIFQARILEWVAFPFSRDLPNPPFPSQGDLPNPGIKPKSPALQVDSLLSEPPGKPAKASHLHFSLAGESWLEGNELHVE